MKRVQVSILVTILFIAALLFWACTDQPSIRRTLEVNIVEHMNGCFSSEEESTTAMWDDDSILITTVVQMPVPCYQVKSIDARQVKERIAIDIGFEREEGYCIECLGFQKLTYRILSPSTKTANVEVEIDIDGQKVKQATAIAASKQIYTTWLG